MKEIFLTSLRDKSVSIDQFRNAADKLASLIASESGAYLGKLEKTIKTPLAPTRGAALRRQPILIAILRSGFVLLPPFIHLYPQSPIGFVGAKRDELTAEPHLYYKNFPPICSDDILFILDPMVATGQSAALVIDLLKQAGAEEKNMVLFSILAAPEGVSHLKRKCPQIKTNIVHVDERLDPKKWIVPGLGDFGDRYFGTIG